MRPGTVANHVTADVIAHMLATSVSNVYRMASEHKWRKVRVGRRTHYHLDDVDRTTHDAPSRSKVLDKDPTRAKSY